MNKNNWEKEFDELFGDFNAWADMGDPEKEKWSGPKEIKSFIRKLLKGKTKVSKDKMTSITIVLNKVEEKWTNRVIYYMKNRVPGMKKRRRKCVHKTRY